MTSNVNEKTLGSERRIPARNSANDADVTTTYRTAISINLRKLRISENTHVIASVQKLVLIDC
jgi:hypothetical protein